MAEFVYAVHDFTPEHDDEIAFNAGERIQIVEKDDLYGDGWWQVRRTRFRPPVIKSYRFVLDCRAVIRLGKSVYFPRRILLRPHPYQRYAHRLRCSLSRRNLKMPLQLRRHRLRHPPLHSRVQMTL